MIKINEPVEDKDFKQKLQNIKANLTSEEPVVNWKEILDGAIYEYPDMVQIEAVVLENIKKKYIGRGKTGTEITKPTDDRYFKGESEKKISIDDFKDEVVSLAKGLIEENSLDISKTPKLYDVLMDHISKKFFRDLNISEVSQDELKTAFYFLPLVKEKFTRGILKGIFMELKQ